MSETARIIVEVAGGTVVLSAEPRVFRTGSRGFFASGKVRGTDGRRFQVIVNVVEIGSKPAVIENAELGAGISNFVRSRAQSGPVRTRRIGEP